MSLIITCPCCDKRLEVNLTVVGLQDFVNHLDPSMEKVTIEEVLWLLKVGINLVTPRK